jgi:hypothetical protein
MTFTYRSFIYLPTVKKNASHQLVLFTNSAVYTVAAQKGVFVFIVRVASCLGYTYNIHKTGTHESKNR